MRRPVVCSGRQRCGWCLATAHRRTALRAQRSRAAVQCSANANATEQPAPRAAAASSAASSAAIFPAGKSQAKVALPALWVFYDADALLQPESAADVDARVQRGATALVVHDSASGGANLFKATSQLLDTVRGRVPVLVQDRVDIATACNAEGVLLSENGVPVTVARQLLSNAAALVGVYGSDPATCAQGAADGANFVVLQRPGGPCDPGEFSEVIAAQRSGLQIPILVSAPMIASGALRAWVAAGAEGLCGSPTELDVLAPPSTQPPAAAAESDSDSATAAAAGATTAALVAVLQGSGDGGGADAGAGGAEAAAATGLLSSLLVGSEAADAVLARVKAVMRETVAGLRDAVPDMSEIKLLVEAVQGLDEPFLLVVAGEFNSGKSSVINALLGSQMLEQGILPTTNEISILKHTGAEARTERTEDGLFVRHLPSELLRKVNVVDTPGTNVILGRQQRLTEEFVPRSDLVLFIMSADRPFTESEVTFLKYIKQWGKKVVFIVNKVDLLASAEEVQQVVDYVSDNAASILALEAAKVLPVSARLALDAKVAAGSADHGGVLDAAAVAQALEPDERWQGSRFAQLERWVLRVLTGAGSHGGEEGEGALDAGESTRLKLMTPVTVAEALLQAAAAQLEAEVAAQQQEVATLRGVDKQLQQFRGSMESDAAVQRTFMRGLLEDEAERSAGAVSRVLQLSNAGSLLGYLSGGASSSARPLTSVLARSDGDSTALDKLSEAVREHATWVETNGSKQLQAYAEFVQSRMTAEHEAPDGAAEPGAQPGSLQAFGGSRPSSLDLVSGVSEADELERLEQSVRNVVLESASSIGGVSGVTFIVTSVLPSTLEDLLALGLAGAVSYISILSWPVKRGDIKADLLARYGRLADELDAELAGELARGMDKLEREVQEMVAPLLEEAVRDLGVLKERQARLQELSARVLEVKEATLRL